MDGRECYHCQQWIGAGDAHDCWTTTEASLTRDLPENLQEACFLEVCLFLGRTIKAPQIRRARRTSKVKVAHTVHIRHRDQVEAPVTEWLREAYGHTDMAGESAAALLPRVAPTAPRARFFSSISPAAPAITK